MEEYSPFTGKIDCQKEVKSGIEVEAVSSSDAYIIRHQCVKYKGKYVKLIGDTSFIRQIPVEEGGDGVYTFIFDQDGILHTARVINAMEIGSIHKTLVHESNASRILSAGEMRKEVGRIIFNLSSGSYMLKWMTEGLDDKCNMEIEENTYELLQGALPGIEIEYTPEVLISSKNTPITQDQLDYYVQNGLEVRLYETAEGCLNDAKRFVYENQMRRYLDSKMSLNSGMVQDLMKKIREADNFTLYKGNQNENSRRKRAKVGGSRVRKSNRLNKKLTRKGGKFRK